MDTLLEENPAFPSYSHASVAAVDFRRPGETNRLRDLGSVQREFQSSLETLGSYLSVLRANKSIARHTGKGLFRDRIESKINESFTNSHPPLERLESSGTSHESAPSWADLVQEDLNQLRPSSDGNFRWPIGDQSIVLSREERDLLCSPILKRMLQGVEPEDLQKEKKARSDTLRQVSELEVLLVLSKWDFSQTFIS